MSVRFGGTWKRSGGVGSAIAKQQRLINLKPLKKIEVKFDPFTKNVRETREFLFSLTGSDILATNLNCKIKTDILCDRSEPSVTFTLSNNEVIVFKSGNLTNLELLKLYNKHITPLASTEEPETTAPKTKSDKKASKKS